MSASRRAPLGSARRRALVVATGLALVASTLVALRVEIRSTAHAPGPLPVAKARSSVAPSSFGTLGPGGTPGAAASGRGQPLLELPAKRTPFTETWATEEGGQILRSFATRQYFRSGTGYEKIDPTLVPDHGGSRTAANDWTARFPETLASPLSFEVDGATVEMAPEGANPGSRLQTSATRAAYRQVWPGAGLEYVTSADQVKEDIVLDGPAAPSAYTFRIPKVQLEPDPATEGALRPAGRADGWRLAPLSVATATDTAVEARPRYELARDGDDTLVTISVEPGWLASLPPSAFPVRIDPSFSRYPDWNWWALKSDGFMCTNPTQDYCWPKVGSTNYQHWRTSIRFPFNELQGKTIQGAWMYVYVSDPVAGHYIQYDGLPVGAGHATCVNNFGCLNPYRAQPQTTVGKDGWLDLTSLYQTFQRDGDWGAWLMMFGWETFARTTYKLLDPNYLHIDFTYNTPPPAPSPLAPPEGAKTVVPQQSFRAAPVADGDGQGIKYRFLVRDAGQQGQVSDSGYLDTPQWTIGDGVLQDGVSYNWVTCANDGVEERCGPWQRFSVDSRKGKDATQSLDSLGPFDVDLATGNLVTSATTHSTGAIGGSLGVSLQYDTPSITRRGLVGEYFSDPGLSGAFPAGAPGLTRVDQNIDFSWDQGSPASGRIGADGFLVRWKGYFLPPASGSYQFGTSKTDDGVRVILNDVKVLDAWGCCPTGAFGTSVDLNEGQAVPITVEYREATGLAEIHLMARGPKGEQVIPPDWFRTEPSLAPNQRGLRGSYYSDVNGNGVLDTPDGPPFLVRNDNQVSFDWPGAPTPGAPADRFLARWTGFLTAPVAGSYEFGASGDDTVKITIDDTAVVSSISCCATATAPVWGGTTTAFAAGQVVKIQVDYFEAGGPGSVGIFLRGAVSPQPIPATWLSPKADVTPDGWHLSVDPDGAVAYERIRVTTANAQLTSPDGTTHEYAWNGSVYTPPPNEHGSLTRNADGSYTMHDDDGRIYIFGADGTLTSVTSPVDDRRPGALRYVYGGTPSKLLRIEDGVDPARQAVLQYAGQPDCGSPPSGFDPAPTGFLCAVKTNDGRLSRLWYRSGRLSRLELPGGATTDWGYDPEGRISQVRDSLATDAITAGLATDTEATRARITYDAIGRVQAVRLQQPDSGNLGPEHTYEYRTSATLLHASGVPEPAGHTRRITYDDLLRTTGDTDRQSLTTTTAWDPVKDLSLSNTDPLGERSTTLYDAQDRPTDTYGPAPAAWFGADRRPASRAADVPHTATQYDGGIPGLAVAYFGDKDLLRAPQLHSTGVGPANGDTYVDWGTSPPVVPGSSFGGATGWGARLTGYITLPEAGTSTFRIDADDAVRLWINDQPVIDDWTAARSRSGTFTNPTAGAQYRIRLDYADFGGGANLKLFRTPPGGAESSALGSLLTPGYGLATRSTTVDAQAGDVVTSSTFDRPENGLLSTSTVDPVGLALASRTSYETPGTGFLRRTSRSLPGGTTTTYASYAATDTADNPCTPGVEAARQGGMPRQATDPDPDGAGPLTSRIHETIYDDAGRAVATRVNADGWTCTAYDSRGRVSQVVVPAANGSPSRVVTNDYAVSQNPLVSSTTDDQGTIQTTVDLLGRTTVYRDALGTLTTTTYDRNGLVQTRSAPGGVERNEYDTYQRPWRQWLDDKLLATTTYDGFGRIASVDYPTTATVPGGTIDDTLLSDRPASRWPARTTDLPALRDSVSGASGVAGPGVQGAAGQLPGGGDALGFNLPGVSRPLPRRSTSVRLPGNGAFLRLASSTALNTIPLTVEAWLQTTQASGTRQVVGKWAEGGSNGWRVTTSNGRLKAVYAASSNKGIGLSNGGIDGGFVADGKPHHIAFTVDTSGGSLYVDGVQRASGPWVGRPAAPTTAAEFRVGLPSFTQAPTAASVAATTFSGAVDDVMVHRRVLSAAEVAQRSTTPPSVESSTLLWWKLDEAAPADPVADASGNGRTGTMQAGPVPLAPALSSDGSPLLTGGGTAATLDGATGAITLPAATGMAQVPLTVEAWVKTAQVDGTSRAIVAKQTRDATPNGWALSLQNGEVVPAWTTPGGKLASASGGVIADGRAHHLLWSVTATQGILYVDGRPQLTQAWTAPPGSYVDGEPLRIGATATTPAAYTAMSVDDVSVHSSALSEGEALRRATYPHDGPQPALADLRLDEASGTTVQNASAGQPAGTAAAGVTWTSPPLAPDQRDTALVPSPGAIPAPYTFETWVRTASSANQTLIAPTGPSGLQVDVRGSGIAARLPTSAGPLFAQAAATVTDGALHQVAVTVSTAAWSITVDGAERASGALAAPLPLRQAGQPLRLGAAGTGSAFAGWIEELDLYPTALDPARLRAHWNKTGYGGAGPAPTINRLAGIDRDELGRTTGLRWQLGDGTTATDAVTRSASGRINDEAIDGVDARPGGPNFTYDGAGRLDHAWVPGHALTYGFTDVGACAGAGALSTAGRNSNRMSMTDNGQTTTYCYDAADRLLSSSDPTVGTPQYDPHGNTTRLGSAAPLTVGYDAADRHTRTVQGTTAISLRRDSQNRILERTSSASPTTRYGYTGPGDAADLTLDMNGAVLERLIALPGGVILTQRPLGQQVWSFPNIHGDVMATGADGGVHTGATLTYDPYGRELSGKAGNATGGFFFGWLGQSSRLSDADFETSVIEMGARLYSPTLGRFLSVDPIEGGSFNDYDYSYQDPVNRTDIDGSMPRWLEKTGEWGGKHKGLLNGALALAGVGCAIASFGVCGAVILAGGVVLNWAQWKAGEKSGRDAIRDSVVDIVLDRVGAKFFKGAKYRGVAPEYRTLSKALTKKAARSRFTKQVLWQGYSYLASHPSRRRSR